MDNMLIIHHNDTDGRAAANIVREYFPPFYKFSYLETNYTDLEKKVNAIKNKHFKQIYIVDVSFTKESAHLYYKIKELGDNVVWIDHHKSSIDVINDGIIKPEDFDGIVSNKRCGAYLAFIWFVSKMKIETEDEIDRSDKRYRIPRYLELVDDYDRHTNLYENSNYLNYYLRAKKVTDDDYKYLENMDSLCKFLESGKIIYEYLKEDFEFKFSTAGKVKTISIDGEEFTMSIINSLDHTSLAVGSSYETSDVCIIWHYNEIEKLYKYSAYAREYSDFDCEALAKSYGGGGHLKASGFATKEFVF